MTKKIMTGIAVGLSVLTIATPTFAATVKTGSGERKVSDISYKAAKEAFGKAKKIVGEDGSVKEPPTLEASIIKKITDKDYAYLNKYVDNMLASKVGWVKENGGFKYYSEKDGKPYTGWHYMGKEEGETTPHWSYFGKDGTIYTGWRKMGKKEGEKTEHFSYFGANGWLRTGWQKLGKADGEKTEHFSYFGANGWLRTGWQKLGKADGEKTEHFSYFGNNGWLVTGWKYMDKSQGEKTPHWSYFGTNGWMRTGIVTLGKADGEKVTHKSFFGSNGWLVVNKVLTINKEQYIADGKGWLTLAKTEHEKTLARAMELVAKVTNDSMSKEQKLRACYIHIRDAYPEYNPRIPHFAGQGWHLTYANDIFVGKDGRKGGNCISVGAALAYMAKAIGFENVYAVNGTGHGWAEVNNKVYDAEWERHNKGSFYAVSYDDSAGKPKYKWIFSSSNPYARIRL